MKINFIPSLIAIAISSLIAYACYSFHSGENHQLLTGGAFLFLSISSMVAFGFSFEGSRNSANIKVVSGIFFFIALLSNLIFTFINFSVPVYVITNGILLLIFLLIIYSINKVKQ